MIDVIMMTIVIVLCMFPWTFFGVLLATMCCTKFWKWPTIVALVLAVNFFWLMFLGEYSTETFRYWILHNAVVVPTVFAGALALGAFLRLLNGGAVEFDFSGGELDIGDPANPASPLSPANIANPASPLHIAMTQTTISIPSCDVPSISPPSC